ncbi:MAG: hypothetical protein JRN09_04205 [Nitrososphaerota archaeon]|nr:hypothetical protein [Nitrososphaerota archaeon]
MSKTLELLKSMAHSSVTDYFADGTLEVAEALAETRSLSLDAYYAYQKGCEDALKKVIQWLEMDLAGRRCNVYGEPLDS